jgi:hypothetical protein
MRWPTYDRLAAELRAIDAWLEEVRSGWQRGSWRGRREVRGEAQLGTALIGPGEIRWRRVSLR